MSRKDFEAWISNPPYERMCDRGSPGSAWPGQYKNYETQLAWEAWQAATAKQREKDTEICESFIHTYVKDGERWMRGDNGKPDFRIKDVTPHLEAAYEMEQILKHGSVIETITVAHKIAAAIRDQDRN